MVWVSAVVFSSAAMLSARNASIAPTAKVTIDVFSIIPFFIVCPFLCLCSQLGAMIIHHIPPIANRAAELKGRLSNLPPERVCPQPLHHLMREPPRVSKHPSPSAHFPFGPCPAPGLY